MTKRVVPGTKDHLHTFFVLSARVLLAAAALVLFAACTAPFNASIIAEEDDGQSTSSGENSEPDTEPDTELGVTEIVLESPRDLETFFDDDSTTQLSEQVTITADVSDGSGHAWWVDGLGANDGEAPYTEVTGADSESLTILRGENEREHEEFEAEYPVGTTITVTLLVEVDSSTYSGSHTFEVVEPL